MLTDELLQHVGVRLVVTQIGSFFHRALIRGGILAMPSYADEASQIQPAFTLKLVHPTEGVGCQNDSFFLTTMAFVFGDCAYEGAALFLGVSRGGAAAEELFQTCEERMVIGLYRHEVVASVEADFVGDFLLAADGIKAEGGSLDGNKAEQFGHGRDLVGLGVDLQLCEAEALFAGKGAELMQVALFARAVEAMTKGFAINGD